MTPEVGDYLANHRALAEARAVMGIGLANAAGRAAYLAAYHAAQAYIFTGTGQAAKTHSGVRSEFSRLAKDDPRIDRSFLSFLAQAYTRKRFLKTKAGHLAANRLVVLLSLLRTGSAKWRFSKSYTARTYHSLRSSPDRPSDPARASGPC